MIAFEIAIHSRPSGTQPGPDLVDGHGRWPTLAPAADAPVALPVGGDECLQRLGSLPRLFVEPDGSFVWVGRSDADAWQVDGQVHERDGRVLSIDLKGLCPEPEFDRLLAVVGWPARPVMMQILRAGVFLDENAFREQAAAVFRGMRSGG